MDCKLIRAGALKPVAKSQKKKVLVLPKPVKINKCGITKVIEEPITKPHDLRDVLTALNKSKTNKILQMKYEDFEPKPNEVCDLKYIGDMSHLDLSNKEFSFIDHTEESSVCKDLEEQTSKENIPNTQSELDADFLAGLQNLKLCKQSQHNELILNQMLVERERTAKTVTACRKMVDSYTNHIKKIQTDVAKQHEIWQEECYRLHQEEKKQYQEAKDRAMKESETFELALKRRDEAHQTAFQTRLNELKQEQARIDALEVIPEPEPLVETVPVDIHPQQPATLPVDVPPTPASTQSMTQGAQPTIITATPSSDTTTNPTFTSSASSIPACTAPIMPSISTVPVPIASPIVPTPTASPTVPATPQKEPPVLQEQHSSAATFEPAIKINQNFDQLLERVSRMKQEADLFDTKHPLYYGVVKSLGLINQLSGEPQDPVNTKKFGQIIDLLQGKPVTMGRESFCAGGSSSAMSYIKMEVSKRLIGTGGSDLLSESTPVYVFLACKLWSTLPEMGDIIFTELGSACPYLLPRLLPSTDTASEAYKQLLGYKFDAMQQAESDSSHCERMKFMGEFYGRLVSQDIDGTHPHGLHQGWMWLSRVLNQIPLSSAMASVLNGFLTAAADSYVKRYGIQFKKILLVLQTQYREKLEKSLNVDGGMHVLGLMSTVKKVLETTNTN